MTTNRRPLARKRNASFTAEILTLFLELEHTPARRRRSDAFKAKEKKLMYELGLVQEFWSITSVLDPSTEPTSPPEMCRHQNWHTCHRVRKQLLAATGSVDAPKAAQ